MAVRTVGPTSVTVVNDSGSGRIIGEDPWGDMDDGTFAEVWTGRASGTWQDKADGTFAPVSGVILDVQPSVRLSMDSTGNATMLRFALTVYDMDGGYRGMFDLSTGSNLSEPGTVYQFDAWDFFDPDNVVNPAALRLALASGITVRAEALGDFTINPPESWMLRVHRLVLVVTTRSTGRAAPLRCFPRGDDLGPGAGRSFPPPSSWQHGRRYGGGYR